jgi:hypothetical protein
MRLALAICAVLVALPVASAEARRVQTRCDRRGTTITANARARIFFVPLGEGERDIYGCARRGGKVRHLATNAGQAAGSFGDFFQLSGTLAGFADVTYSGASDSEYAARTLDLRTGRTVRRFGELGLPVALSMARNGSLAIITALLKDDPSNPQQYEVRRIDRGGATALDTGPDVDPQSLAVAGSWVYWTRGGAAHSAPIS